MTLVWTRSRDGEHNGRPNYEYHATCEDRTYHIVWACDHGGMFGYTAVRKNAHDGATEYLTPTGDRPAIGITWAKTLKRCKAACGAIDARYLGSERTTFVPQIAGAFETFNDWVHKAANRISEPYCPMDSVGHPIKAICLDAKGRRCQVGGDFMRARDEDAFPVVYFWHFKPRKIS